jgi:hypothetical protein
MVIEASVYVRFYIEVGVGVCTFLPTPTPPKFLLTFTPQPWFVMNEKSEMIFVTMMASMCPVI